MKKLLSSIFLVITINAVSLPQGGGLIIGDNYRIHPSTTSQSEVFITNHPNDPNILFATANTLQFQPDFFISEGVYVTTNSGASWIGTDTCQGANIFFHGGDPAIVIDKNGTFVLTRKGTSSFQGIYSHYSTDNGVTWSSQKTVSTDEVERATLATDVNPASNFYGRTYSCWARLFPPYPIGFSYTNDGGQNWSTPIQLSIENIRRAGGEITSGPENEIYICWARIATVSPFNEINVGFASSTNGGANWSISENAFPMNGIVGILPEKQSIRVNGLPRIAVDHSNTPTKGTIYIVTSQKNLLPAGSDPDIILRKSTDKGATWSDGIRVNQDQLNNGKYQFFPGITVDDFGGVNIIFYDDRNTTSDSLGIFMARSTDGGTTWNEYEIGDHNFRPIAIGGLGQGYMGDNIDITSVGNKLFPVWMDNSTGIFQLWSVPIEFFQISQGPPNIQEPITISQILKDSFTIEFNTERNGNSKVRYGLTESLELDSLENSNDTTFHSFKISNLQDSTRYYFQVFSSNNFGTSTSQIYSVLTLSYDDTSDNSVLEFELKQNYPNPFNPGTVLEFTLPTNTNVTLKVYDIAGREIVTLIDEFKASGKHKVNFSADQFGLSSGVYFYRITTNGYSQTRSMVLLK